MEKELIFNGFNHMNAQPFYNLVKTFKSQTFNLIFSSTKESDNVLIQFKDNSLLSFVFDKYSTYAITSKPNENTIKSMKLFTQSNVITLKEQILGTNFSAITQSQLIKFASKGELFLPFNEDEYNYALENISTDFDKLKTKLALEFQGNFDSRIEFDFEPNSFKYAKFENDSKEIHYQLTPIFTFLNFL